MQLEELQAAQATAQGAIDTARTDTEVVRASMQDLQVDNQRCCEAVESVAGRCEVGALDLLHSLNLSPSAVSAVESSVRHLPSSTTGFESRAQVQGCQVLGQNDMPC